MKRASILSAAIVLIASTSLTAASNRSPALTSLVESERAFARTSVDKTLREAFLAYFADDGINFQPHPVNTKRSFRNSPAPTTKPTLVVDWAPTFADVSRAGDLGYTTGPATLTDHNPAAPSTKHGTYFTIWKKQSDGSWKVVLDAGSDGPGGPPASSSRTLVAASPSAWTASGELDLAKERKTLEAQDQVMLEATGKRGLQAAYLEALDSDARLHRWGSFPVIGTAAAREFFNRSPHELTWKPMGSDIASSADLGYTWGSYRKSIAGVAKPENGYYVRVWKRDANGRWKIALDTLSPIPTDEASRVGQGYQLLADKKTKEAIELFKELVADHPKSANAHDSLSDAYEADGNIAMAVELARKAIELMPADPAPEDRKRLVRESAEGKIQRLVKPRS